MCLMDVPTSKQCFLSLQQMCSSTGVWAGPTEVEHAVFNLASFSLIPAKCGYKYRLLALYVGSEEARVMTVENNCLGYSKERKWMDLESATRDRHTVKSFGLREIGCVKLLIMRGWPLKVNWPQVESNRHLL